MIHLFSPDSFCCAADKVRRRNKKHVVAAEKVHVLPNKNDDASENEDTVIGQTDDEDSCNRDLGYGDYDWDELPDEGKNENFLFSGTDALRVSVREAATFLGFTKNLWDSDIDVSELDVTWVQLAPEQQEAATVLGYDQVLWDAD